MKRILLVVLIQLIILVNSDLFSQAISFSAINKTNNSIVKLDSVIITDLFNGASLTIINNFNIDLLSLTDVQNTITRDNSENLLDNNICISDYYSLNLYLQRDSKVNISVYNSSGKLFSKICEFMNSGSNQIRIDLSNYTDDVYFITIQNNAETCYRKILKLSSIGLDNNLNKILAPILKNTKDDITVVHNFKFIGYSRGFYHDTLDNILPVNGQNFEFQLTPLSQWNISKGTLSISYPVIYTKLHTYNFGPDIKTSTTNDTIIFNYDINLYNSLPKWRSDWCSYCDTMSVLLQKKLVR